MDYPPPANGREIGECIYCGTHEEPLTREHVIPYGLNGPWTLARASCKACSDVTTKFEHGVMRSLWPHVRTVLSMQSRHQGKGPATLPLYVQRRGAAEYVQIPKSEYPLYLLTPLMPPPSIAWSSRILPGAFLSCDLIHLCGPSFEEVRAAKFTDAEFVGSRAQFQPNDFVKMLVKIALCIGVLCLGPETFKDSPLPDMVLGKNPDLNRFVGGWYNTPMADADIGVHAVKVFLQVQQRTIHVFLRLFAQFGGPEYQIIAGTLHPELVDKTTCPPSWLEERDDFIR